MKSSELIGLLVDLAKKDLAEGADINDHPCMVAAVKIKSMSITTGIEGRYDCPVIQAHCDHYCYQCDRNGEVAICYCKHPDNPTDTEGNCSLGLCPVAEETLK